MLKDYSWLFALRLFWTRTRPISLMGSTKSMFLSRSRMSSWLRISCLVEDSDFLAYIRPSFVQYALMSWLNLRSDSSLTRLVLKVVRFSVMKILSGSPFRRLLALYTLSRILYDRMCNQCLSPLTLWVRIKLRRGVLDVTLCEKVCQWLATGRWFFSGFLHQ